MELNLKSFIVGNVNEPAGLFAGARGYFGNGSQDMWDWLEAKTAQ
jgi:hypothetical protein